MERSKEQLEYVEVHGQRLATVFHPGQDKRLVLFCHGFRGSKIGPNRFFVQLARQLQDSGVCSLRFDQYGSGDSDGDFLDSSFVGWMASTKVLAERYLAQGYRVALLGQSMGGSAVLAAAADLGDQLSAVVAWVPDPSVDELTESGEFHEEGGQRVSWKFWREAHAADLAQRFRDIRAPTLVFFATEDEYVSAENQRALTAAKDPHQHIVMLDGHSHSSWSYEQADQVIESSRAFLLRHL